MRGSGGTAGARAVRDPRRLAGTHARRRARAGRRGRATAAARAPPFCADWRRSPPRCRRRRWPARWRTRERPAGRSRTSRAWSASRPHTRWRPSTAPRCWPRRGVAVARPAFEALLRRLPALAGERGVEREPAEPRRWAPPRRCWRRRWRRWWRPCAVRREGGRVRQVRAEQEAARAEDDARLAAGLLAEQLRQCGGFRRTDQKQMRPPRAAAATGTARRAGAAGCCWCVPYDRVQKREILVPPRIARAAPAQRALARAAAQSRRGCW